MSRMAQSIADRNCSNGAPYENEYTLFVRAGARGIEAVFEAPDTLAAYEQMIGSPVGDSFIKLGAEQLALAQATRKDS